MKLMDPLSLCKIDSAAPALNRGLAILAALDQTAPLSLEELAVRLPLPKASLFRLLSTLQQMGLVQKNSEKYYEPLWKLHPLKDRRSLLRQQLEKKMAPLSQTLGSTAEWYEPQAMGMKLILQNLPETEIRVQARPGMLRTWQGEFEAVTRLGLAFAPDAPTLSSAQIYSSHGVSEAIGPKKINSLLAHARKLCFSSDPAFNTNAVRRHAVAAFDGTVFLGVLALAEVHQFGRRRQNEDFIKPLQQLLKSAYANRLS